MSSKSFDYVDHIVEILNRIKKNQWEGINRCAEAMADSITAGRSIFAFGASHAGIVSQELFYRTGGLAVINAILPSELMLNTRPVEQTSAMERLDGYPSIILKNSNISPGDMLLIHSVSGRNTAAIEMALEAGEKGVTTAAITNISYSNRVTSRHKSRKKLFQICDIVIDNCGEFEDSSMLLPGMKQKIGPTSSVTGCAIANMIVIRTVEYLLERGIDPPVFRSANVDGGDEFNKIIFEKYKKQIHYR